MFRFEETTYIMHYLCREVYGVGKSKSIKIDPWGQVDNDATRLQI